LEPGEESVGANVQVEHLAGTPLGAEVRGVARATAVEGRSIQFDIAAFDRLEQIGRGTHRRAIVRTERVAQRIAEKAQAEGNHVMATDGVADDHDEPRPQTETLRLQIEGAIATVTLNRPAKKNAVNWQMTEDWERMNRFFGQHPEIRVVLVQGAGEAFCAGDDVPEVGTLAIPAAEQLSYRQARVYLGWEQLPQVFIAVIDGVALGAGCVAAVACDFRIASHAARFGMPEILLGWPPGYGVAQLMAVVGKARAMEMCLTGQLITARQAREDGLVHRLTASGQLQKESWQWAEELLALPAEALRETKRLLHADEGLRPKTTYLADTAAYIRCLQHPDAREGIAAFAEKREPRFGR
jgi:enoyl-CoA hydratase